MQAKPPGDVTQVLARMQSGDRSAEAELLDLAYDQLRALAASQLKGRGDALLQPTVLVHELFLRLTNKTDTSDAADASDGDDDAADAPEADAPAAPAATNVWKSRGHFMAVAATAMRQILIDHLRRSSSLKRGGDRARVSLSDVGPADTPSPVDLIALSTALERLAELDPKQARLVELKVFGGLSNPEIAEVLGTSLRTTEREWRKVRAWLARELGITPPGAAPAAAANANGNANAKPDDAD